MLALAAYELELAQEWAGWTQNFNSSVLSEERALFFRCLNASLELFLDDQRDANQYRNAFIRMFGEEMVTHVWNHVAGEEHFFGLQVADSTLQTFKKPSKTSAGLCQITKG